MQMKGVLERWPDVPAAAEAKKLLLEYDDKTEKPWEKDDIAEQRRFLIASARALTGYATEAACRSSTRDRGRAGCGTR